MKRTDLLAEYERVKKIARALAVLQSETSATLNYPDDDIGMSLSADGAIFYDLEDDPYEAGHYYSVEILVPWADIDAPAAATERLQQQIAAKKARDQQTREAREREQYEQLRRRFGQ